MARRILEKVRRVGQRAGLWSDHMRFIPWERWPKLFSLFRHEQWNIGLVQAPIQAFLDPHVAVAVQWMPRPGREEYWADPFGVVYKDQAYLLYEFFDYASYR